jgi:hypothetical protein
MPRRRSDGPESFLVLWSKERHRQLRRVAEQQPRLNVIFGGPHLSLPSFTKFGVRPGDWILPVFAQDRQLYLMCGATIREVQPIRPFLKSRFGITDGQAAGSLWSVCPELKRRYPEVAYLRDDECVDEAAICESTPLRFDRVVPPAVLMRLTFCSSKGERPLRQVEDGKLKSTVSIQNGYFRLTPDSATDMESLLADGAEAAA